MIAFYRTSKQLKATTALCVVLSTASVYRDGCLHRTQKREDLVGMHVVLEDQEDNNQEEGGLIQPLLMSK